MLAIVCIALPAAAFPGDSVSPSADPPAAAEPKPIPTLDGKPLDEHFPVLAGWIHPVTDAEEVVPVRPERKFGAKRYPGGGRKCKRGHCGVDLDGPRGRPVVSVAAGTVIAVERRRNGKDGRSGRYIKIEHDGGVLTAYMHLDSIAPGISKGDVVSPGDVIGTLGKSGIRDGDPHLHFALEVPTVRKKGHHRFVDPTPFIQRARIIRNPSRWTTKKPTS
jgi:murein DD-endopeptidase MepM/ murein hydrolase activator NlpD